VKPLICAFILCALAFGQSAGPKKKHFLIRIQPVRATFVNDATKEESKTMGVHFEYLKKLMTEGKIVLAGPSINGEKTFGLIIVEVENEAEARAILEGDPSYKAGIQGGEVFPFTLSLIRESAR
jgi:uncharacterized protein